MITSKVVRGPNVNEDRHLSRFYVKSILSFTENMAGLHFKDQSFNAVLGGMYLLRKLYEMHKRTVWEKMQRFDVAAVVLIVILGLQWSFKAQVGNKALTLERQVGTAHTTRFNIKNPTFCPTV